MGGWQEEARLRSSDEYVRAMKEPETRTKRVARGTPTNLRAQAHEKTTAMSKLRVGNTAGRNPEGHWPGRRWIALH